MRMFQRLLLVVLAVGAVSAGPPRDLPPSEWIRLGNEAFEQGDLDAAERYYAAAAERTDDPGLVAFNQAALFARKKDWRAAELHYLRALDDQAAPPDRLARAWYNRGVCLLERGESVAVYRTAIACFEQARDRLSATDPLVSDVEYNLELAKVRWAQARAKEKTPPRARDLPPDAPQDRPPSPEEGRGSDPDPGSGGPGATPTVQPETTAGPPPGSTPRETNRRVAGAGNLPVILDSERPQPLSPEDTRLLLHRIAERLERDRRANARMLVGPERPDVRDW